MRGVMPTGLKRYQHSGDLHYITFNCYRHLPHLGTPAARDQFDQTLERVRRWYGFYINAYVAMPEHVHLLMSEPERSSLAVVLQMLKQIVSHKLGPQPFWERRYYDFNVWSEKKFDEKMHYIHQNPVRRGLVARAEDWKWSSFLHIATGAESVVEVESKWTARKRERLGMCPTVKVRRV